MHSSLPLDRRARATPAVRPPSPREAFDRVRAATDALVAPLSAEDCVAQSMTEASPIRWQIAHTTWFFETFVLTPALPGYRVFHPRYGYLFNSYYDSIGERTPRPDRGRITRPGLEEIRHYRRHVDEHVRRLLELEPAADVLATLELGLHHEQQHQELMRTDLKHLLSFNPLKPAYVTDVADLAGSSPMTRGAPTAAPLRFVPFEGGLLEFGHSGEGFAFDNEGPRHRAFLEPFELASRPATSGEYLAFMAEGGYRRPELWLSDGWAEVQNGDWRAPLYWEERDGRWHQFTLTGEREVDPAEPVTHVSLYEADAFARWSDARLPSELEWELAAREVRVDGNFVESGALHPRPTPETAGVGGMFGDVWEWTASPYSPYPRYKPARGALGEYNGKFMCNQMVLRGGSCASPHDHLRATYRNFFPPNARWQFSGVRLARDL